MTWQRVMDVYELLDDPKVNGDAVADFWRASGISDVRVTTVDGERGALISCARSSLGRPARGRVGQLRRWELSAGWAVSGFVPNRSGLSPMVMVR